MVSPFAKSQLCHCPDRTMFRDPVLRPAEKHRSAIECVGFAALRQSTGRVQKGWNAKGRMPKHPPRFLNQSLTVY